VNFFEAACQSGPFELETFGLCDDASSSCAYVDTSTPAKWIATVSNPNQRALTFTAVDKCVLRDGEAVETPRCDGMLTAPGVLYLVELKDQRAHWLPHAMAQLESTIKLLHTHHAVDLKSFRHKKAFACNRRNGAFRRIDQETQLRFFRLYGFRIDVQSTVLVLPARAIAPDVR